MFNRPKLYVVHSRSGCCFWRTWQPCEEMRKQGLVEVRYQDSRSLTSNDLAEGLKWCDVMVIRGLLGTDGLDTMRRYQSLGKKVATDYDDLYFNVSPFNPAYRDFGMEEVQVKDPTTGDIKYLWKDGEEGLNIKRNKIRFHAFKSILQEADLITTPTVYLKNAMVEISGREDNIKVVPNSIDLTQWRPMPDIREKLPGKFRFGWAVSNSHGEDWLHIKSAIVRFLDKHKDAVFVCIGDASMQLHNSFPKDQFEWYPFSDLWEYHYPMRMAMLGLDVGIAPLADLEFNKCKSPLKYAEYTAFGWPTIAQKMEPYSSHIVNGETGLLAGSMDEWVNALEALYSNPSLRSKLHFNASFALRQMFDLRKVAAEWANVFKNLINQEVTTL